MQGMHAFDPKATVSIDLESFVAADPFVRRVAAVSGGRFNPPATKLFESGNRVALRVTPLWPYLLMAALTLFVFDVALRRIDFSFWWPSWPRDTMPSRGGKLPRPMAP